MSSWYEDDQFWLMFAPVMFEEDRWAAAEEEVREAARMLGLRPEDPVMDSCSGVGRHSLEFARMGYRVTAVDRTEAYLEAARDSADADGLEIEFVLADVRTFIRKEAFSGIVNLFTSFGYFDTIEEELTLLRNYHESLREGGRLVIDVIGKELLAHNFKPSEWYEYDGMYVIAAYSILEDWTKLHNRWVLYKDDEKYEFSFAHRIFSGEELKQLLRDAGFSDVRVYGDLKGSPYDVHAERLVACGTK